MQLSRAAWTEMMNGVICRGADGAARALILNRWALEGLVGVLEHVMRLT